MKFLIDMNLSPRWLARLEAEGWEAVHVHDLGRGTDQDSKIMQFAYENAYVLLTQDLDFGRLLAASGLGGPSVVQLRIDGADPDVHGDWVAAGIRQVENALTDGALVSIDLRRHRVLLLPMSGPD